MPIGKVSTFTYENQVRLDYVRAYYRKLLLWARFAKRIISDFEIRPGNKAEIPIFEKMGAAEKPGEDDRLAVDSMGDKSISTQVYEIGKAWGITDAGRYRKGSTDQEWEDEAANQAARVLAEQLDADALACLANDGTVNIDGAAGADPKGHDEVDYTSALPLTSAFTSQRGTDTTEFKAMQCGVDILQDFFTETFGDRAQEANVMVMHSRNYSDALLKPAQGIMKADAVSPFKGLAGYAGNFLGKDTIQIDNISGKDVTITDSAAATQKYKARKVYALKPAPFLILIKQGGLFEQARDILGRRDYNAITEWYCMHTLHKQIDPDDIRAGGAFFITKEKVA